MLPNSCFTEQPSMLASENANKNAAWDIAQFVKRNTDTKKSTRKNQKKGSLKKK